MTTTIYLSIAGGILLLGGIIAKAKSAHRRQNPESTKYIDALHQYIEGNTEKAIEGFKAAVKTNSANIMAYIYLGAIYRDQGHPIRAAKVHRHLLVRGDLTENQANRVLYQLVLDYKAAGALEKAVEMAERLTERAKKNIQYRSLLLKLYEAKGEWDKAIMYSQSLNLWQKKSRDMPRLAQYKVQSGLSWIKRGAEREGRIRFREAIKLNPVCPTAYIQWGESYIREHRTKDAVKVWKDFTEKCPQWAHLVFDRLSEILFDLGRFEDMESILKKIVSKSFTPPDAALALAKIHQKKGRHQEAIELCRRAVDANPESFQARALLVQLLQSQGDLESALAEAVEIINETAFQNDQFICSECGHTDRQPFSQCPKCHTLNQIV